MCNRDLCWNSVGSKERRTRSQDHTPPSAPVKAVPTSRPPSNIFKYYFCFAWDKLSGLRSFFCCILFLKSLYFPPVSSHSLESTVCQDKGPRPVTLLVGCSSKGRLGGQVTVLWTHRLSPSSLFPGPYQVSSLLPQAEAFLFSKCLVITPLGEGGRRKHSGTLRSGAGSESSDHTGYSNQVSP